jgi:DNA-binding transcriptional MerR regulator
VLRYWEQEFAQLKPMKRRGNRRYYQHHEVLLIRRIRELLYDQGFTISGARNQLTDLQLSTRAHDGRAAAGDAALMLDEIDLDTESGSDAEQVVAPMPLPEVLELGPSQLRAELLSIRDLLVA